MKLLSASGRQITMHKTWPVPSDQRFTETKLMEPTLRYLLIILLVFSACSRTVYVPVLKPAFVDAGPHVQTIAIVDRTTSENTAAGIIESVLTGTTPAMERDGAQRAVEGLYSTLENSPRFTVIRTTERLTTPAIRGNWPPPLTWDELVSLSVKYRSDAILVLESFNADYIVTDGARTVSRKVEGKEVPRREYYAQGVASVNLGFRLYDVKYKAVADEYMFSHNARWETSGTAIQMALGGLIDRRHAINDVSFQSGVMYADRISPQWIRLNRDFFTKGRGNNDFRIGVRRATVNDWHGATEAWHRSALSRKRKTAGRSAYNLALMYEIHGDLHKAREWAQLAYTDYGINKARTYVSALERRIRDQRITEDQLR